MVTPEEMRAALSAANNGAQVPVPPALPTGIASTSVFSVSLPKGCTSPFVVVAGPLVANAGALPLGIAVSAGLELQFGYGNQLVTCIVDLPVGGTVVQVPPCNFLRVTGKVNAPASDISNAGWSVYGADGVVDAPAPMVTSPPKTVAAAASATFQRQAQAIGYRLFSSNLNLGAENIVVTQENASPAPGPIIVYDSGNDIWFPGSGSVGTTARDVWMPLHPLTTEVRVLNNAAGDLVVGVQWLLQLGAR